MENLITLDNLGEYENGRVVEISLEGKIRNRLNDLGLITGTSVECLHKNHGRGLNAYLIRGAVIALRSQDTSYITISVKADT